jgi:hypothetical protein
VWLCDYSPSLDVFYNTILRSLPKFVLTAELSRQEEPLPADISDVVNTRFSVYQDFGALSMDPR